ncbi:MAG: alpha-2-macroglobulin, partial [Myxococcales bacterium]
MPSNQTLWTVTAVAADASGRFGESTAEFASRGGTSLLSSLPLFLRDGDEARGSVRVAQGDKGEAAKALEVAFHTSGALLDDSGVQKISLPARGEATVPLMLRASKAGMGKLDVLVSGLPDRLADLRAVAVQPSAIEETIEVSGYGGGELKLPLPEESTVQSVELLLQPSLVDAALTNVRALLTYPYGCLEQLVATTVPNIALYRTLEKANALDRLDPGTRALLSEARSRSVQGTDRILALAVKGGGFTWFSGYSTPSPALTLIALDGLSYAADAGLVSRTDRRLTEAATWIAGQELPLELDAVRTYVLTRLQGNRQAAQARALLEKLDGAGPTTVALAVLAAEQ